MADFKHFHVLHIFSVGINSEKCQVVTVRSINQCGHPKRAELPDVNINTGMQSINTERAILTVLLSVCGQQ